MGLRDDILASEDLPLVAVDIPEWGMTVYVRSMTGTERDLYEVDLMENKDSPLKERLHNMRAKLVVLTTVDEDGERVFADEDVEVVGKKSATALNHIVEAAQTLNALTDKEVGEEAEN